MPDERSPLLQNGQELDGELNYLAVNEPEHWQAAIHASGSMDSDAEQQTVAAQQNFSVLTLVRLNNFLDYVLYSNIAFGQR